MNDNESGRRAGIAYAERRGPRDGEYMVAAFDIRGNRVPAADYYTDDKTDADNTARAMINVTPRTCGNPSCGRPLARQEARADICNTCYARKEGHLERFGG